MTKVSKYQKYRLDKKIQEHTEKHCIYYMYEKQNKENAKVSYMLIISTTFNCLDTEKHTQTQKQQYQM